MRKVEPHVFFIAATAVDHDAIATYLEYIGSPAWEPDSDIDGDLLVEMAGRLCYRSWQPYDPEKPDCSNPNVEKVRKGDYIKNILKQGHGSVLEHVCCTFIFAHVSRVFTHEQVRHRAGMAYSQESLRYVRLDQLSAWCPPGYEAHFEAIEKIQQQIIEEHKDQMTDFNAKKKLTSRFRRLAPLGLATSIMCTGNLRAWRHIIAQRTAVGAEEEIRKVYLDVAEILAREYPACFQDMKVGLDDIITFGTEKI